MVLHVDIVSRIVEENLRTKVIELIPTTAKSGRICDGIGLVTECGKVFVKMLKNSQPLAETLFRGELESLKMIEETNTLSVPKPLKVTKPSDILDSVLILEYLEMTDLTSQSFAKLGEQLARMHLDNPAKLSKCQRQDGFIHKEDDELSCVNQYGFHIPTCNGKFLQDNTWQADWWTFFIRNKLQPQIELAESQYGDREVRDLWPLVLQKLQIPSCFCTDLKPSLLHGDFHVGNIAESGDLPVTFDPSCFYGHHEFDLSMAALFGGFPHPFWEGYHCLIPKTDGFQSRQMLYTLHIHLNHWNHFGPSGHMNWREEALKIMRTIITDWD